MEVNIYPISTVSRKAGNKFLSYISNAKRYFLLVFHVKNINVSDSETKNRTFKNSILILELRINIKCACVTNI